MDFGHWIGKEPPLEDETVLDLKDDVPLDIIRRQHWKAVRPKQKIPRLLHPVLIIRFFSALGGDPCKNPAECKLRVQATQRVHIANGLPDIAYNFLIGGDGLLYEGRGWNWVPAKIEDKLKKYDGPRLDITYIGQFNEENKEFVKMAKAAIQLINYAMFSNFLKKPFIFLEGDDERIEGPLKRYLHS